MKEQVGFPHEASHFHRQLLIFSVFVAFAISLVRFFCWSCQYLCRKGFRIRTRRIIEFLNNFGNKITKPLSENINNEQTNYHERAHSIYRYEWCDMKQHPVVQSSSHPPIQCTKSHTHCQAHSLTSISVCVCVISSDIRINVSVNNNNTGYDAWKEIMWYAGCQLVEGLVSRSVIPSAR